MPLTETEFTVLSKVATDNEGREMSPAKREEYFSGYKEYFDLTSRGLIKDALLTEKGKAALLPYKVKNAVILAAGLSSRFAPITYEKPKGLLEVKGEKMVERIIRQLQEVGIEDISVVVGYKKELYSYLEEHLGVRLVVNEEYSSRDNHSSLYRVLDSLSNTYVCTSDTYYTENLFNEYEYRTHHTTVYYEEPSGEWYMTMDEDDRIRSVTIGGSDSWVMLGHAYLDTAFSEVYTAILREEYDCPETIKRSWEQVYISHINDLDMRIKKYERSIINEFDCLEDLRKFDATSAEILENKAAKVQAGA